MCSFFCCKMAMSLRLLQRDNFFKILSRVDAKVGEAHLSTSSSSMMAAPESPLVWKVLILDTTSQKMMAPLVKVSDLHEYNVTLHL